MKKILLVLFLATLSCKINANPETHPLDSIGFVEKDGKIFIKHKVDPGQTLYAIGRRYKIDVNEIRGANTGMKDNLQAGQVILVPCNYCGGSAPLKREEPVTTTTPAPVQENDKDYHTVRPGETLFRIASIYNLTVDELKSLNGLSNNEISVGQKLKIKKNGTTAPPVIQPPKTEPKVEKPVDRLEVDNPNKAEEAKREEPKTNPVPTPKPTTTNGVVEESGTVEISSENEFSGRIYAFHPSIPVGTILMITNKENNKSLYVRITGKYSRTNGNILMVTPAVAEKLGLEAGKTMISLSYTPD